MRDRGLTAVVIIILGAAGATALLGIGALAIPLLGTLALAYFAFITPPPPRAPGLESRTVTTPRADATKILPDDGAEEETHLVALERVRLKKESHAEIETGPASYRHTEDVIDPTVLKNVGPGYEQNDVEKTHAVEVSSFAEPDSLRRGRAQHTPSRGP
jgi:hypothetical protein